MGTPGQRAANLRWNKAHPENMRANSLRYSARHRVRLTAKRVAEKAWHTFRGQLRAHGLTLDQYHARLEAQDFLCAICRVEAVLHIDHDHATLRVRGLLCRACNVGIGWFQDSCARLVAAAGYLGEHGA